MLIVVTFAADWKGNGISFVSPNCSHVPFSVRRIDRWMDGRVPAGFRGAIAKLKFFLLSLLSCLNELDSLKAFLFMLIQWLLPLKDYKTSAAQDPTRRCSLIVCTRVLCCHEKW